jgi:hypothetical protein
MPRSRRSITYRLQKGQITQEQAEWYATHRLRWYGREFGRGLSSGLKSVARRAAALGRVLKRFDYLGVVLGTLRFLVSQRYRADLAHRYVQGRIDRWSERGQLAKLEAGVLGESLRREEVGSFITDFGVHIAIKPAIKLFQWAVLPALFAAGVVGPVSAAVLVVFGGMAGRTFYTIGRMVQAAISGGELPWVALLVGAVPVAGNAAYPCQVIYQGAERDDRLAGFILYDTVTRVGEKVPIWGGRDTGTEHFFNRLADWVVRHREPLADGG